MRIERGTSALFEQSISLWGKYFLGKKIVCFLPTENKSDTELEN
jgi:hypothetical protein